MTQWWKGEQKTALKACLGGQHAFVLLPAGFGKSSGKRCGT